MTDPSYLGQILVFTSPLIGNYGVPSNEPLESIPGIPQMESSGIQCSGVIVTDVALKYSHYLAVESLHEWCERHGVPGISGVDTRAVTTLLRDQGTTLGRIAVGEEEVAKGLPAEGEFWDPSSENLIEKVSTKEPYVLNPDGDVHIAVLDFGTKANILRSLVTRNAKVTVLPWNYDFNSIRDQVRPDEGELRSSRLERSIGGWLILVSLCSSTVSSLPTDLVTRSRSSPSRWRSARRSTSGTSLSSASAWATRSSVLPLASKRTA